MGFSDARTTREGDDPVRWEGRGISNVNIQLASSALLHPCTRVPTIPTAASIPAGDPKPKRSTVSTTMHSSAPRNGPRCSSMGPSGSREIRTSVIPWSFTGAPFAHSPTPHLQSPHTHVHVHPQPETYPIYPAQTFVSRHVSDRRRPFACALPLIQSGLVANGRHKRRRSYHHPN
jgi:hypothetical protein